MTDNKTEVIKKISTDTNDDICQTTPLMKNTVITIDGNPVGGIVDFNTSLDTTENGVFEYLSHTPYSVVSSETKHKITLKMIGNNEDYGSVSKYSSPFNLEIYDVSKEYKISYKGCTVLSESYYISDRALYRNLVVGCGERVIECE